MMNHAKILKLPILICDAIKGYEMDEQIAWCAISDVKSRKKGKYLKIKKLDFDQMQPNI